MTTLQTVDGRLLRRQSTGGMSGMGGLSAQTPFPPMWSDGERWGPGGLTSDGYLRSYESIYRSQPVIAAVVDKLSRRIATLPFGGFELAAGGTRSPVLGDSLDSLIRRPYPKASGVHLLHHVAQSLLVHANAVVAKARTHGDRSLPPDTLWPLDWAQMSAYGPVGGLIEWWSTTQFDGQERLISADDVIHFAWGAPSGSQVGVSPLEKLGVTLRLEDATQRHQTAMFKNGSRPSLAVSLAMENPKNDLLEYARARVEAMHKGSDNSGRTFFMGANVNLQPLSLTPVETELIEQRKLSREEVGMVYDLAGPLMNDLTHGTYSNVTELQKGLYRDVIPPWTELIVQTFQTQLLDPEPPWLDRVVRFDFTDKLKGEPRELAETLKIEVEAGLRTRNEARYILGLPPIGDPVAEANPHNQLTMNVNNQAPVGSAQQPPPAAP
jgi:HK97 family phage portal protein